MGRSKREFELWLINHEKRLEDFDKRINKLVADLEAVRKAQKVKKTAVKKTTKKAGK